jgi:hypothetical protein
MTLEGRLEADVSADGRGTTAVEFAFTVRNVGPEPATIQFPDACKAEFVVREDGREVWCFTEGRMFAQMLSSETLGPDETVTYEAEWMGPEAGGYAAVAELRAREATCEARTQFAVQ